LSRVDITVNEYALLPVESEKRKQRRAETARVTTEYY